MDIYFEIYILFVAFHASLYVDRAMRMFMFTLLLQTNFDTKSDRETVSKTLQFRLLTQFFFKSPDLFICT